jgi:hypothetical protein
MIRTGVVCLYLFLFDVVVSHHLLAQIPGPPPATDSLSLREAILSYTRTNAAEMHLYNGILYAGYDRHAIGHPFFQTDSPRLGSVTYDGIYYPDILLSYDLEKDIVVIPDKRQAVTIQLLIEKLRYFSIGRHHFLRLLEDSSFVNAPAEGFYEILYSGKATALARHKKVVQRSARTEEDTRYLQYDSWYVRLNGRFYLIHKDRDLFKIPDPRNDALKDYLKKNHISFKKDPEYALAKAAEFYSQPTN